MDSPTKPMTGTDYKILGILLERAEIEVWIVEELEAEMISQTMHM